MSIVYTLNILEGRITATSPDDGSTRVLEAPAIWRMSEGLPWTYVADTGTLFTITATETEPT